MTRQKAASKGAAAFWKRLGPGLIAGAADDDPSGIATYSQVGASFGYEILWTTFFTFPLMVGIQVVSARIGRVTGDALAANIRRHYPPWATVAYQAVVPSVSFEARCAAAAVAEFGTTISPYLFFWQASQEVEEQRAAKGDGTLKNAPEQAHLQLKRIQNDTYVGVGVSNLVAFFIMLAAVVTLRCCPLDV